VCRRLLACMWYFYFYFFSVGDYLLVWYFLFYFFSVGDYTCLYGIFYFIFFSVAETTCLYCFFVLFSIYTIYIRTLACMVFFIFSIFLKNSKFKIIIHKLSQIRSIFVSYQKDLKDIVTKDIFKSSWQLIISQKNYDDFINM